MRDEGVSEMGYFQLLCIGCNNGTTTLTAIVMFTAANCGLLLRT